MHPVLAIFYALVEWHKKGLVSSSWGLVRPSTVSCADLARLPGRAAAAAAAAGAGAAGAGAAGGGGGGGGVVVVVVVISSSSGETQLAHSRFESGDLLFLLGEICFATGQGSFSPKSQRGKPFFREIFHLPLSQCSGGRWDLLVGPQQKYCRAIRCCFVCCRLSRLALSRLRCFVTNFTLRWNDVSGKADQSDQVLGCPGSGFWISGLGRGFDLC